MFLQELSNLFTKTSESYLELLFIHHPIFPLLDAITPSSQKPTDLEHHHFSSPVLRGYDTWEVLCTPNHQIDVRLGQIYING